jgi:protein O-GlcNAc transferase
MNVERSTAIQLELASAYIEFGRGLLRLGRPREASAAFERALALRPNYARAHSDFLRSLNYRSDICAAELFAAHLRWDRIHGRKLRWRSRFEDISRDPTRRLRVGYVSPYFRRHTSVCCREPLLAGHDHSRIEVFCYADVDRPDAVTSRLKGYAGHWTDIHGWSSRAVAERILADRIDVLVDLVGHFKHNRLKVFARKPAPVQVGLVYPNTTGLSAIDYRIVDAVSDPPGAEAFCSERLIRLPRCFLSYLPHPQAGPVLPLPARRTGHVTFGSFNWLGKVTPEVVALWGRVLRTVPGSRLFLKAPSLTASMSRCRVLAAFSAQGIDPGRIRLEPYTPAPGHFREYGEVDIALDPFPYNGAVTSLETMWMGVPLVSLRGDRHAARVGASLLTAVRLPELIAETPEDYVGVAARLADDLDRLGALRAGLRQRVHSSPLCDGAGFARAVERAYRAAWREWCSSEVFPVAVSR